MVWLYRSPIPVRRRGVISSFKWFLPAFATRRERGGRVGALWSGSDFKDSKYTAHLSVVKWACWLLSEGPNNSSSSSSPLAWAQYKTRYIGTHTKISQPSHVFLPTLHIFHFSGPIKLESTIRMLPITCTLFGKICTRYIDAVLWIRIRSDLEFFVHVGSGSDFYDKKICIICANISAKWSDSSLIT